MRTVALVFAIVAGLAVLSMMAWTFIGWARSDRARTERHAREDDEGPGA
jgi:hypothetical protein